MMIQKLTPSLLGCVLMAGTTISLTTASHAAQRCSAEQIVFSCTTQNKKQLRVCDKDITVVYQYGRSLSKPELELARHKSQTDIKTWQGGTPIFESIQFMANQTAYKVYQDSGNGSGGFKAGGVIVKKHGKQLADVKCITNTIQHDFSKLESN